MLIGDSICCVPGEETKLYWLLLLTDDVAFLGYGEADLVGLNLSTWNLLLYGLFSSGIPSPTKGDSDSFESRL